MKTTQEIAAIIAALKELYPDAACSLDYGKDYELLFSVRLAAQCTDARVNLVTPALFQRYPTLEAFADADVDEVGRCVQSCGFWRAKARDIVAAAQQLLARFGGKVPDNMEDLLTLPGVGRKTANLILGDIYGQEGYVCDTHCIRITGRLGITDGSKDPLKVEQQLRKVIPPEESNNFCHRMVLHEGWRNKVESIFFGGIYVGKNTAQTGKCRSVKPMCRGHIGSVGSAQRSECAHLSANFTERLAFW